MENKNKTLLEVEKILKEYKDNPELEVSMETRFDALELDSLDTVDLVMEIEDKMGVQIEMSKEIQTIGNIVEIVEKQRKG